VKGALNRLAESNLHVIARQIEDLFMSNSRNLMNECLCQILTASKPSVFMKRQFNLKWGENSDVFLKCLIRIV